MEMNRKTLDGAKGNVKLSQDGIAWFTDEPSMCEDTLKITEREGALVVENISDSIVKAPAYVYYKNFTDDTYIGGITYRSGTQQDLAPGETAVLNASHFDPEASKLMFVSYAP